MKEVFIIAVSSAIGGVGTIWVYVTSKRRKKLDDFTIIQNIYKTMSSDTDYKIGQLTEEVKMLRKTVELVYDNCNTKGCKNYMLKKPKNNNNA